MESGEIEGAIRELNELLSYGKPKSISGSLFLILKAAYRSSDPQLLKQARALLDRWVKSRLQRTCLYGCVMLAEEQPIQFAQLLHDEEYKFGDTDVNYICEFAVHNKQPKIMESLMQIPDLFKLDEKARNAVYGSLATCYGENSTSMNFCRNASLVNPFNVNNEAIGLDQLDWNELSKCQMCGSGENGCLETVNFFTATQTQ
uniref:Uncharacterized protein n=1 Tax=Ascaris lumbricoides TaxID=6252 RepID=A0A9J2PJ65_ASCLU